MASLVAMAAISGSLMLAPGSAHAARGYELVSNWAPPVDTGQYGFPSFGQPAGDNATGNWASRALTSTVDGRTVGFFSADTLPGLVPDGMAQDPIVAHRAEAGWQLQAPAGNRTRTAGGPTVLYDLSPDGTRGLLALGTALVGGGGESLDPLDQHHEAIPGASGDAGTLYTGVLDGARFGGATIFISGCGPLPVAPACVQTPEGVAFRGPAANSNAPVYYLGGSPDMSAAYFLTAAKLVPEDASPVSQRQVYRWTATTGTQLVSRLPNGSGAFGGRDNIARPNPLDRTNVISEDGSSATFSTTGQMSDSDTDSVADVYQVRNDVVTRVSVSEFTGVAQTATAHNFEGASADGNRVYFSTTEKMVGNGTTTGDENAATDLYLFDVRQSGKKLSRVSVADDSCTTLTPNPCDDNANNTGPENTSAAKFVAVSDDGSHVFFISGNVLTPKDVDGQQSLYVRDVVHETTTYVSPAGAGATTSSNGTDASTTTLGSLAGALAASTKSPSGLARPIRVSEDGSVAAIVLASDVPASVASGLPAGGDNDGTKDLYIWREGRGLAFVRQGESATANTTTIINQLGCLDITPTATKQQGTCRSLTRDGGKVFFSTSDALVAGASSGSQNVYAVNTSDMSIEPISPIGDGDDAQFVDASASGDDVFFGTSSVLDPSRDQDNGRFDIYDARIGSVFPPHEVPAPCRVADGECESPTSGPPRLPEATTPIFVGPGNLALPTPPVFKSTKPKVEKPKAIHNTRVRLRINVEGKGRLRAAGSGLRRSSKSVPRSGTYRLAVKLSSRAIKTLKRKRRIRATVRVTFVPMGGKPATARVHLTFKRPNHGVQGHSSRSASVKKNGGR